MRSVLVACAAVVVLLAAPRRIPFVASFQPPTPIRTVAHRRSNDGTKFQSNAPASESPVILTAWWSNKKKKSYTESPTSFTTKSSSSTIDTYKVLVRPRNRVSFDPDTGRYQTVDSVASSASNGGDIDNGAWTSLKQSFYTAVDVGKSLPSLPRRRRRRSSPPVLEGGYATLERAVLEGSSSSTPGERLLQQYQQKASSMAAASSTTPDGTPTKKPLSSFEKFKEGFYTTLDVASKLFSSQDDSETTGATTFESIQPVVVKTKLATSPQVRAALPDVTSDNPVTKWKAVRQIRSWEEQELQQRLTQIRERQRKTDALKQTIYQVGDAAQAALEASVALPAIILEVTKESVDAARAVGSWLETVPQTVEQSVQTVASIPKQVEQTVTDIQVGVETTITTTQKVVEEISTLPTKVQQRVNATTKAVEEAVTNAKVLVGLEKAQPKPPKVPPPPPKRSTPTVPLGWKVAGILAGSTAQLAWWTGKGVAWMTWKGAELAWKKASEQVGVATLNQERPETTMTATPARSLTSSSPTSSSSTTTTTTKDKDLEREVQQALDLASEALRLANDLDTKAEPKNVITPQVVDSVMFQRTEGSSNNISKEEL